MFKQVKIKFPSLSLGQSNYDFVTEAPQLGFNNLPTETAARRLNLKCLAGFTKSRCI